MDITKGQGIHLDLEKIADDPGPYTISYGFNLDLLCESIRKVGLLNAPLVSRNEKGGFDIVSGFRRILALKAVGEPKALCKDITSAFPSSSERFLANFYENLATRKFNEIEKAMILEKLRNYVAKEEILASFMPLIALPSHEHTFELYLKLVTLEEPIQKAIAQDHLSIKAAKVLVGSEKSSRLVLFNWIDVLKFNINQQIKFLEYVQDISMRENATIREVLSEESFLKMLEHPRLNSPQKAKKVLEMLKVKRYPRLTQAQQVIESRFSAIPLPPEANIHYDPYFEDPSYHLEIRFKNGKDLKNTIRVLHASDELEAIPDPWAGQ